jgi:hypothetical protein
VKEKGASLWKFETHHCIHGGSMEQGKYFDFLCSPTISYPALQIVIPTATYFFYYCASIDVTNYFQKNIIDKYKQVFTTTSVCYIE